MNRRDFLRSLAGIPLLGFLKPEVIEVEEVEPKEEGLNLYDSGEIGILPTGQYTHLVKWNGAGDSWKSVDGGETWTQTGFRPTLEIQFDGALYVSGDFLEEDIEQVRQRHCDYYQNAEQGEEDEPNT